LPAKSRTWFSEEYLQISSEVDGFPTSRAGT
jgi:hypothetical protein